MKVKAGYKQTDIGLIPDDWSVLQLGEGIKLSSGYHVLAKHCNTDGEGMPYITGPADFPHGVIQNTKFTTKPGTICNADDILVTVKGSGAGTIVLANRRYCISRQLMAVSVQRWNKNYIYYSLLRNSELFRAAATGLIPGLSRSDILNATIVLPSTKAEQEAIAEALSDADALIEALEQLIAKKRQIKQGAMEELLTGKRRLPGFEKKYGYKETEIGEIPEDWEVTNIGDVSQIFGRIGFRGYTINDIVEEGKGAITISPSNIQDNKTDFSNCTYISWEKYEQSPEIKIANGDILLVKTGSTIGKTAVVKDLPERATINPQIVVLKKIRINNLFLGYSMGFTVILQQLKATTVGGALPTLSQKQIAQFKFPLPTTIEEQTAIAEIMSDMDAEIAALEGKLSKARQVKQGMMQELLTGKIRLI